MIVCSCANVSEKQILDLLPCAVEDVMFKTNCSMSCGACFQELLRLVEQYDQKHTGTDGNGLTTN